MIDNGNTNQIISAKVITINNFEKIEVSFLDTNLRNELASINTFDEFVTSKDRLQLIIVPEVTDVENMVSKIPALYISKPFCRIKKYS